MLQRLIPCIVLIPAAIGPHPRAVAAAGDWEQAYQQALDALDYEAALRVAIILRDPARVCRVGLLQARNECEHVETSLRDKEQVAAETAARDADQHFRTAEAWARAYASLDAASAWEETLRAAGASDLPERINLARRQSQRLEKVLESEDVVRDDLDRVDPVERFILGCHLLDRGQWDDARAAAFDRVYAKDDKEKLVWQTAIELLKFLAGDSRELPNVLPTLDTNHTRMLEWFVPLACRVLRMSRPTPDAQQNSEFLRAKLEKLDELRDTFKARELSRIKWTYERLLRDRVDRPFIAQSVTFNASDAQSLESHRAWWYAAEAWLTLAGSSAPPADWAPSFERDVTKLGALGDGLRAERAKLDRRAGLPAGAPWPEFVAAVHGDKPRKDLPDDALLESAVDYAGRIDAAAETAIVHSLTADKLDAALGIAQQAKLLRVGLLVQPLTGSKLDEALRVDGRTDGMPKVELCLECFCGPTRAWLFAVERTQMHKFSQARAYELDPATTLRERLDDLQGRGARGNPDFDWVLRSRDGATTLRSLVGNFKRDEFGLLRVWIAPDGPLRFVPLAVTLQDAVKDARVSDITYLPSVAMLAHARSVVTPDGGTGPDYALGLWQLEIARNPPATYAAFKPNWVQLNKPPSGGRALRLWGTQNDDAQFSGGGFDGKLRSADRNATLGEVLTAYQKPLIGNGDPPSKWARIISVQAQR